MINIDKLGLNRIPGVDVDLNIPVDPSTKSPRLLYTYGSEVATVLPIPVLNGIDANVYALYTFWNITEISFVGCVMHVRLVPSVVQRVGQNA